MEEGGGGEHSPNVDRPRVLFTTHEDKAESPPSMKEDKGTMGSNSHSCASSPLLDTAPLPNDDDALCPYCGQHFRKPRVLDCLHSMCEDCIIAQLDGRRDGDSTRTGANAVATDFELEQNSVHLRPTPPGVIRCPICRQESRVGNDVRFVNHLVLDFVRIHEAESANASGGVRACRACKSEQPAMAVCKQCASDLCKNCVQAHRDMKLFDGHTVLTYSEVAENELELPHEPVMCISHPTVPYTTLCTSCETLVCAQCQPEHADSRHHNIVQVDERVGQLIVTELRDIAAHADAKAKATESACGCIPERQRLLADQYEAAHSQIEEAFADYQHILEEAKQRLLSELEKVRDEQDSQLNNLSHRISLTAVRIADALAFTERLLAKGSAFELLASRKKVRQQLTSLAHSIPDMSSTVELSFSRASHAQFAKHLNAIVGNVSCRLVAEAVKDDSLLASTRSFDLSSLRQLSMTRAFPSDPSLTQATSSGTPTTRTTPSIGNTQTSAFSTYSSGPGTIGMERRQKSTSLSAHNSVADFSDGWPPSSIPPEPPSPSPPSDFTPMRGIATSESSFYNWPPSSNPPPVTDSRPGTHAVLPQPTPSNTVPSSIHAMNAQHMSAAMNSILGMQKPNSLWMAQQAAAAVAAAGQLPNAFAMPVRHRTATSIFDPLVDPSALRLALNSLGAGVVDAASLAALQSALPQIPPPLSRQSQCGTPSEQIAASAVGLLNDRQFLGLPRGVVPKNIVGASDLILRWHIGGIGVGPGQFNSPHGFCLGCDDEILVADTNNHRIQILSKQGKMVMQFGIAGTDDGHLFYPKKVVALRPRASLPDGGYIVVDKGDNKARLQLFSKVGEFIHKIVASYIEYVSALTVNDAGHVVVFNSTSAMFVLDVDQGPIAKILKWADCGKMLCEASDVSVFEGLYYVTDYKQHCVVVLTIDGDLVRRFGAFEHTPYPIGVDVSKTGDVLVADSHGNHFHILVCSKTGQRLQDFECTQLKVSRCVGLRITSEGNIVSISKHNHNVLMFNTLYLNH
uniref:B box-type domain-containing protein n=2 Tax=Ascaris TaxID=6251 RepID=A0A9J2P2H1_ASCLU